MYSRSPPLLVRVAVGVSQGFGAGGFLRFAKASKSGVFLTCQFGSVFGVGFASVAFLVASVFRGGSSVWAGWLFGVR